jgi:hypothetical protein
MEPAVKANSGALAPAPSHSPTGASRAGRAGRLRCVVQRGAWGIGRRALGAGGDMEGGGQPDG